MILAAGEGRRLRPLTDQTPKPLLALGDEPLLGRTLRWLDRQGFARIVINAHHHARQIAAFVETARPHCHAELIVSTETVLLGTGGGIHHAAPHWHDDGAWIINGDVACNLNFGAIDVVGCDACMVLRAATHARDLGPIYTDDGGKRVVGILQSGQTSGTPLMFTGLHYLSKPLALKLPEPSCVIRNGYIPWLTGQHIGAHVHAGYWNEIGTPEALAAVRDDFQAGKLHWLQ